MAEERMKLQATVSVRDRGSEWLVAATVFGFGRGSAADRQAKGKSPTICARNTGSGNDGMVTKSEFLRDMAEHAREKAQKAHSHEEGTMQRRRQSALNQLAENEEWLNGYIPAPEA